MPKVKEFPISVGQAPPSTMSFPNIQSAAPAPPGAPADNGASAASADPGAVEANDGFTPEERRKN